MAKLPTAALVMLLTAIPGRAAEVKAARVEQPPKIDGPLSEPAWQSAVPFSDFRMVEPEPNSEPSEKTELRVLYDDANLYIGVSVP